MIKLRILDKQELSEWNSVLDESPNATLFHTMEWLSFLETTFHLKKLPLGIYEDGQMVGVFPALLTRKGPFKILGSPLTGWGTPYMGPVIETDRLDEVMGVFDDLTNSLKVDYVEVGFRQVELSLPSMGKYVRQQVDTHILELEGTVDKAWSRLKPQCRNHIRSATKNGVKIMEVEDRSWVEEFYPMLVQSFMRSRLVPSKSKEFYYNMWDFLRPAGRLKVLFAEYKGKRTAYGVFLMYRNTVYCHSAATPSEYNKLSSNNLLQWHLIKWAAASGFQIYDMVGKGIPSIDQFKASFGSHVAWYPRYCRTSDSMAGIARRAYQKIDAASRRLRYYVHRFRGTMKGKRPDEGTDPNIS